MFTLFESHTERYTDVKTEVTNTRNILNINILNKIYN